MPAAPVVIVGGGTSGAIVARTIADATDLPVVVIEPGGITDDDNPRFLDGLTDGTLWRGEQMPQARAVGGGSAVNGMILSGDPPRWLSGLTRRARADEAGAVGLALLEAGGRLPWMWWNNGRWNPGRAMLHLQEEGRIRILRDTVTSLRVEGESVSAVITAGGVVECSHVVMCAGAILTPRLLRASGITGDVGEGLQNHPTVTFTVRRPGPAMGFFDACTVLDISRAGAVGLMIAYERETAAPQAPGSVGVSLMNPQSRGMAGETADFALLSDPVDRARMSLVVDEARKVLARAGLGVLAESGVHPVSHATSSCRHVVGPEGDLRGFRNVTLADASVLPGVPAETPAASVTIESLRISRALGRRLS